MTSVQCYNTFPVLPYCSSRHVVFFNGKSLFPFKYSSGYNFLITSPMVLSSVKPHIHPCLCHSSHNALILVPQKAAFQIDKWSSVLSAQGPPLSSCACTSKASATVLALSTLQTLGLPAPHTAVRLS